MLAGALGGHLGLRQNVAALAPHGGALQLLGGAAPARSTLADATRARPAALFVDFLRELIGHLAARSLRRDLTEAVRLVDATQLDLGLRMRSWLGLHKHQAAAKLHVVYDPRAERPVFFALTSARLNDITVAKEVLQIEAGASYVFDLGYYDFSWWAKLDDAGCRFVTRLKVNTPFHATEARAVAAGSPLLSDRLGRLSTRLAASRHNPFGKLGREIRLRTETGKTLRLFTNDLTSSAAVIADLYKQRWQIELFFK